MSKRKHKRFFSRLCRSSHSFSGLPILWFGFDCALERKTKIQNFDPPPKFEFGWDPPIGISPRDGSTNRETVIWAGPTSISWASIPKKFSTQSCPILSKSELLRRQRGKNCAALLLKLDHQILKKTWWPMLHDFATICLVKSVLQLQTTLTEVPWPKVISRLSKLSGFGKGKGKNKHRNRSFSAKRGFFFFKFFQKSWNL